MLQFPKGFFEAEERDEFLVDTTMKTVWAAELEVLAAIAEVCERHQIPWFTGWGTLLGVVRHQGFVPWDDDMDIALLRPDYDRLMKYLPEELPKGYKVYHDSCGEQTEFWACVMNSEYISVEPEHLAKFHQCPFIVGVDIIAMDYIPNNVATAELLESRFKLIWHAVTMAKIEEPTEAQTQDLKESLKGLKKYCDFVPNDKSSLVTQLWGLANRLCAQYTEEDGDYVACYLSYIKGAEPHNKEWYRDFEYLPFESVYLPVPVEYDKVLTATYGDYMKKVKNVQVHEYPFYNKQLRMLREVVEQMKKQKGVE